MSNPFKPSSEADVAPADRHRTGRQFSLELQCRALLALEARLLGNVMPSTEAVLSGTSETTSASPDTAEIANEIVEQEVALSLLGSTTATLNQIKAALRKIEDGSYGWCEECQMEIPSARLEAIPYASCCVECASRLERAA